MRRCTQEASVTDVEEQGGELSGWVVMRAWEAAIKTWEFIL